MKIRWKPGTMIYPLPAALVCIGDMRKEYNLLTVSWMGTICSDPPMCYISLRPERYSYALLKEVKDFTINLTTEKLAYATDWCGVRSGRDYHKFEEMKLTPERSMYICSPMVKESPLSIECRVYSHHSLGSHEMFIASVLNVWVEDEYLDKETGKFDLRKANPIAYVHGEYFSLGDAIGKFGWSVKKEKKE